MTDRIVDEHFWFTATTLAFNGFLISADQLAPHRTGKIICSTLISLYAVFLIVHRAAVHSGRHNFGQPDAALKIRLTFDDTLTRIGRFPRDLLFVAAELSGAAFYVLLICLSCMGVWLGEHKDLKPDSNPVPSAAKPA